MDGGVWQVQSMGLQKVGHDWALHCTEPCNFIFFHLYFSSFSYQITKSLPLHLILGTFYVVYRTSWWLSGKESVCNAGDASLIPGFHALQRAWHPTPVFLPEESHGQRRLAGYSLWGRKESDTTEVTQHVLTCALYRLIMSPLPPQVHMLEFSSPVWLCLIIGSLKK